MCLLYYTHMIIAWLVCGYYLLYIYPGYRMLHAANTATVNMLSNFHNWFHSVLHPSGAKLLQWLHHDNSTRNGTQISVGR